MRRMAMAANILVALVALEHVWFGVLEAILWTKPIGLKTFRNTPEKAQVTAALAKNQGLYNCFQAAGLLWGLLAAAPFGTAIKLFFLSCVVVAGVVGALTVSRRILVVQAVPAAVALALVLASR
jgi:putative membrane protein